MWLALPAWAAPPENPLGGVRFEPQAAVGAQSVPLVATGLRARFWIKGYAVGLYMAEAGHTADELLAVAGPKRLQMRMLLEVPMPDFIKALHQGFERNNPSDVQARLAERLARFDAQLSPVGKVKKGDTVNLDFVPGKGLSFALNGRVMGDPIPGDDFYRALLLVFVGQHVSDDNLRASLLGRKP